MRCEKCGHEHEKGKAYTFHYGRYVGSRMNLPMVTQSYEIKGHQTAWICNRCRWKGALLTPEGIALIIAFLVSMLYFLSQPDMNLLGAMLLSGGIGFIMMLLVANYSCGGNFLWLTEAGTRQAIHVYETQLKRSGNDSFFTESQYRSLQSVKR